MYFFFFWFKSFFLLRLDTEQWYSRNLCVSWCVWFSMRYSGQSWGQNWPTTTNQSINSISTKPVSSLETKRERAGIKHCGVNVMLPECRQTQTQDWLLMRFSHTLRDLKPQPFTLQEVKQIFKKHWKRRGFWRLVQKRWLHTHNCSCHKILHWHW